MLSTSIVEIGKIDGFSTNLFYEPDDEDDDEEECAITGRDVQLSAGLHIPIFPEGGSAEYKRFKASFRRREKGFTLKIGF
jgi:hypothetical protein